MTDTDVKPLPDRIYALVACVAEQQAIPDASYISELNSIVAEVRAHVEEREKLKARISELEAKNG